MVGGNHQPGKEKVPSAKGPPCGAESKRDIITPTFGRIANPKVPPIAPAPLHEPETGPTVDDIFLPSGRLRPDILDEATTRVLREALAHTRATNWDSVRTPHLFMGLLAAPDSGVFKWATKLGADLPGLLDQFRDLFHQANAEPVPPLLLNREFLSDNVIRLLREAQGSRPATAAETPA